MKQYPSRNSDGSGILVKHRERSWHKIQRTARSPAPETHWRANCPKENQGKAIFPGKILLPAGVLFPDHPPAHAVAHRHWWY